MNQDLLKSLNASAAKIALQAAHQKALGVATIDVDRSGRSYRDAPDPLDATVLDFAGGGHGTIAAGLKLAEICMGGLGRVSLYPSAGGEIPLPRIGVTTDHPLLACIASQYAGWPLTSNNFFAMCSGPARVNRGKEDILKQYRLVHPATQAVGVLETDLIPNRQTVIDFADQCSIQPGNAILCVAPTASLPGSIQVVARSIETALHKLHELGFDLRTVDSGCGWAPLPPMAKDDLQALGRTNDAILYGGSVNLFVNTTDEAIEKVIGAVASCHSKDFGTPFLDVFNRYDRDFYRIDKLLFSPAEVIISNRSTGHLFRSGEIRNDILRQSFAMTTPDQRSANAEPALSVGRTERQCMTTADDPSAHAEPKNAESNNAEPNNAGSENRETDNPKFSNTQSTDAPPTAGQP